MIDAAHRALAQLTASALAPTGTGVTVSVGPPDLADGSLTLNWFLYAVRTVEATRIRPGLGRDGPAPLSLDLRYLLSTHHGPLPPPDHAVRLARALESVLLALHERPVVDAAETGGTVLRVEHDPLDAEAVGRLWQATSVSARTAVGFRVTAVAPAVPG